MIGPRFPWAGRAMVAVALLAFVCTSCSSGSSSTTSSPATTSCPTESTTPIAVPNVNGDEMPQADYYVRCAELKLAAPDYRANNLVPNDFVITTNPAQGTHEHADAAVTLVVSTGPYGCGTCDHLVGSIVIAFRTMPPVCGLTVQKADTVLALMSITLAPRPVYRASPMPRGTIIGSVPATGARFLAYGNRKKAHDVVVIVATGASASSAPATATASACP
jgi:beta-lactam-binding protein with PASTA domain